MLVYIAGLAKKKAESQKQQYHHKEVVHELSPLQLTPEQKLEENLLQKLKSLQNLRLDQKFFSKYEGKLHEVVDINILQQLSQYQESWPLYQEEENLRSILMPYVTKVNKKRNYYLARNANSQTDRSASQLFKELSLTDCHMFSSIDLSDNCITSIQLLQTAYFPFLENIILKQNYITSLEPLRKTVCLKNMTKIMIGSINSFYGVNDIQCLNAAQLPKLESLSSCFKRSSSRNSFGYLGYKLESPHFRWMQKIKGEDLCFRARFLVRWIEKDTGKKVKPIRETIANYRFFQYGSLVYIRKYNDRYI